MHNRYRAARFWKYIAAALLILPAVSGCTQNAADRAISTPKTGENQIINSTSDPNTIVVASVNGTQIVMTELIREMNHISDRHHKPGQAAPPQPDGQIRRQALDNLIFRELAIQEARLRGMTVKPGQIDEVIRQVKQNTGSQRAYREYLRSRGLSEKTFRDEIERSRLFEMITAREIYQSITVDEQTLRTMYEREKSDFMTQDNPPRQRKFEEVREFLQWKAKAGIGAGKMKEWAKKLREKAVIRISSEYAHTDYRTDPYIEIKRACSV